MRAPKYFLETMKFVLKTAVLVAFLSFFMLQYINANNSGIKEMILYVSGF